MTPYLVNTTWVDLDHVLAIEAQLSMTLPRSGAVIGRVTMAFRDEPLEIVLGMMEWHGSAIGGWTMPDHCQPIWDAFIAAWWRDRATDPLTGRPQSFYKQHLLR